MEHHNCPLFTKTIITSQLKLEFVGGREGAGAFNIDSVNFANDINPFVVYGQN